MARAFFATLLACVCLAAAKDTAPTATDAALEARVHAVASELRCLVCQNQTIADSNADLAQDLRREVRVRLGRGESEAQVLAYMTERYGDFVLYRPPLKATTWLLWAGPALLLVGAAGTLIVVLRRRSRLGDERFELDAGDEPDDRADAPDAADASART